MIDYHCHLLPAMDDGAANLSESLAMARVLQTAGYQLVCCTPHCMKGYYEYTPQQVRNAVQALQLELDKADIAITLAAGMEYYLDDCFFDFADNLLPLGTSRLLLCEAPFIANPSVIHDALKLIIDKGFIPLIAHPERSEFFYNALIATLPQPEESKQKKPGFFSRWLGRKSTKAKTVSTPLPPQCLFQSNLGSYVGFYPKGTQQRVFALLNAGLLDCVGSDVHTGHMAEMVVGDGLELFAVNGPLQELADISMSQLTARAQEKLELAVLKASC